LSEKLATSGSQVVWLPPPMGDDVQFSGYVSPVSSGLPIQSGL